MRKALARLLLPRLSADAPSPVDGELWYDTTEKKIRTVENGKPVDARGQADLAGSLMMGVEGVSQPPRETVPALMGNVLAAPSSAIAQVTPVYLFAGDVITNLVSIHSGTGAAVAGLTRMWMALYDPAGNFIKQTADQAATAWAVTTARKLPLVGGAYTVPTSGVYYLMFYWVCTTTGNMVHGPTSYVSGAWADVQAKVWPSGPTRLAGSLSLATTPTAPATLAGTTNALVNRIWMAAM